MATHTRTRTVTTTWARIDLIITQVRITLRRTTNIDETTLKKIFERGLREKMIGEVNIYGVDDQEFCHAEIRIMVDWEKHQFHIQEGRDDVTIDDSKWIEGTSVEIGEFIRGFNKHVRKKSLRPFWRVAYAPGVDVSRARKILGLTPADPVKWKGKKDGLLARIDELDEMAVEFYVDTD